MSELNYLLAFTAGLVSFFAPCVVSLLPAYIGYVTGVSIKDLKTFGYQPYFKKLLLSSIFYILGFSIVFVLLGTAAATIGVSLIGGLIILALLGLLLLTDTYKYLNAWLFDIAFKLGYKIR